MTSLVIEIVGKAINLQLEPKSGNGRPESQKKSLDRVTSIQNTTVINTPIRRDKLSITYITSG